ncbi:MAG TPA: SURF1 family protein [Glycomyces sp.]|nr:SURF1 family protein [Glycomyces sp.]
MVARFKFLVSARWLGLTAAAVCVVVVCALLSQWQWNRAEQRAEANARIEAADDPSPLDAVLPAGAGLDGEDRWTLVEATGTFDAANELVLRARTNDGANGFEIVTPLVLDDGTALLVNRGFVAGAGGQDLPDYPAAPTGEVTVVGRVFESEPAGGEVTAEDGHLLGRRLNLDQVGAHLDYGLRDAWIAQLDPAEGLQPLQPPTFRAWQNYSYAVQWLLFAVMVPVGWVVLVRRELRGESGPGGEETGEAPGSEAPEGRDQGGDRVSPRTGSPSTAP